MRKTWEKWSGDPIPRFGAALAYYTSFAIVPLFVLIIMIAIGMVEATRADIQSHLSDLLGAAAAAGLIHLVDQWMSAGLPLRGIFIDLAVFAIASTRVMDQLQDAVDGIWGLRPIREPTVWQRIKQTWLSRLVLLGVAFMLLASLTASTMLSIGAESLMRATGVGTWAADVVSGVTSYIIVTALFAGLYKWVPRAKVAWSDVWIGALISAVLYAAGSKLIVGYLGHSALVTLYGGAGSFVILLLWSYYASQIYLLGAVFIAVYACDYGHGVVPDDGTQAVRSPTGQ
jgi:membrane protein